MKNINIFGKFNILLFTIMIIGSIFIACNNVEIKEADYVYRNIKQEVNFSYINSKYKLETEAYYRSDLIYLKFDYLPDTVSIEYVNKLKEKRYNEAKEIISKLALLNKE